MDKDERTLRIAATNRHIDSMKDTVHGYFLESLLSTDNSWQKAYNTVVSWFGSGQFEDYDCVELYITSKPLINAGIIAALDDCKVPFRIMEHVGRGQYREIKRDRWAQHLTTKDGA